jgi:hypothetical protein
MYVAGVVEGVVPAGFHVPELRGQASFIDHTAIDDFLFDIENDIIDGQIGAKHIIEVRALSCITTACEGVVGNGGHMRM